MLEERRGYYDLIWVSRAHNLRQLIEVLGVSSEGLGQARVVLDTEAVFAVRDGALARLNHLPFDMNRALGRELESAWLCDHMVAVNPQEAKLISDHTGRQAGVVGFRQEVRLQPAGFAERQGMLHVGALTGGDSPNVDALLRATLGRQPFRVIAAGDEVMAKKPSPAIYELALRRLGVPADRCVAFEDTLNGVRSARGAGLRCVVTVSAYGGTGPFPGALTVISHLGEPGLPPTGYSGVPVGGMVDMRWLSRLLV